MDGISVATDEVRGQILDIIDKNVRSFMTSNSVQAFFKKKCAKNPEVDSYEKTQVGPPLFINITDNSLHFIFTNCMLYVSSI